MHIKYISYHYCCVQLQFHFLFGIGYVQHKFNLIDQINIKSNCCCVCYYPCQLMYTGAFHY